MFRFSKFILGTVAALAAVGAYAQTPAKDALKAISEYQQKVMADARAAARNIDIAELNAGIKALAEEKVKDIDPTKVEPKDAYDWAQVFARAQRHKDVCALAHMYLTTNPSAEEKFQVQMLMMASCNALGEADMLIDTLRTIRPTNQMESSRLMSAAMYADTIAKSKGVDAAVKMLDEVSANLVFEDPKVAAQRNFDAEVKRNQAKPDYKAPTAEESAKRLDYWLTSAKGSQDSMRFRFVEKKADLLAEANRKSDATKVLDEYIARLDSGSPAARSAKMFKTRLTIAGSLAPALNIERGYGGVSSLESLKGKVVIVDMFAHWCGPCIASFPEMRKMYDDLKGKGLEIVGVTTYYGYYKQERPLEKDAEFARMGDFMKEHNIVWPVIYGDRTNFESYGVSGIPTVYIIDRQGRVQDLHVGYSPESFKAFRSKVEAILAKQ